MSNVRVISLDIEPDEGLMKGSDCDLKLRKGLAKMNFPAIKPDQYTTDTQTTEPYKVQFSLNPKAWGNYRKFDPIILSIPHDGMQMHLTLRREAQAAYELGSWGLINELAAGVFGKEALSQQMLSGQRRSGKGQWSIEELRERVSGDRKELFRAFETVRNELIAKSDACLDLLQSYAACRAINEEIPACDALTLNEARRYLSRSAITDKPLAGLDDAAVRKEVAFQYAYAVLRLRGPEGPKLVAAIQSLAGLYRKIKAAKDRFEATLPKKEIQKSALWLTLLGPVGLPLMAVSASEAALKFNGQDSERKAASKQMIQASAEFQSRFTEKAMQYPILFKIADTADKDETVWLQSTLLALKDALKASAELKTVLSEDPIKVWRFPGLIDRSVQKGFPLEAGFAARVASDKLMKENDMPFFARLNAGVQLFNSALVLVPFPPVKVATAIASVIGDAAELLESYFRTKEQRMGFRAAIDPSFSLGPDASYASAIIQSAFIALGLLPIPGAIKEWAEEGANATNGGELRKAVLSN